MGMYCHLRTLSAGDCKKLLADSGHREVMSGSAQLSLEKAWHGLHYMLTGTAWEGDAPLNFLLGGHALGDEDEADAYGPPRLFLPAEVAQIDAALANLSDAELWSRFDAAQMAAEEIYPSIWEENEADLQEEYLGYFHQLKEFICTACAEGKGLVVMLT